MSMQYSGADDTTQILNQALALHRRGQMAEAAGIYKIILQRIPNHFEALHYLGLAEAQSGRLDAAEQLLREAVRSNPNSPDVYANLGNIQRDLGRYDEALESYDRALQIKPDYPNALSDRGIALLELERFDDALDSFDQALQIHPGFPAAHFNKGVAQRHLKRPDDALLSFQRTIDLNRTFAPAYVERGAMLAAMGRFGEALADYDQALALVPDFPIAVYNRGVTLLQLGLWEQALAGFDRVLAIEPKFPDALLNRGNALLQLRRAQDALATFDQLLAINPRSAAALNSRGNALLDLGRAEEALASFDGALAINPASPGVLSNRAKAAFRLQRLDEALASADKALAIDPHFADALNVRGNVLVALGRLDEAMAALGHAAEHDPSMTEALGNRGAVALATRKLDIASDSFERLVARDPTFPYALGNLLQIQMQRCDWRQYDTLKLQIEAGLREGRRVVRPFTLLSVGDSISDQRRAGEIWARDLYPGGALAPRRRYQHERPRVAYLSADFGAHPLADMLSGLFERHDRSRFDTVAISIGPDDRSEQRQRLERAFGQFIDAREKSDAAIAELISNLEIDIVVDLMGFTDNARPGILARRPAGLQVSYVAFPGTMGAPYIDYLIADAHVVPESARAEYSEKVVCLPGAYATYDTTRPIPGQSLKRSDAGLPETGIVFCCFNGSFKIVPHVFERWMRLLAQVDGSVLWLLESNPDSVSNLRREAEARGIAPERLVFAPFVKQTDHLARLRLADLFLDTSPYNARAAALDALWSGVPVVTCQGRTFASRVAGSFLHALGLPELAMDSLDAYQAVAADLARDPARLAAVKDTLARNRDTSALFDAERTCRHLESAFTTMLERHARGEAPAGFNVTPLS